MTVAKAGDETPEEFHGFLPHLTNPVPVSAHDLAKWQDFLLDAEALGPDLKGHAATPWLGRCYRLFVRMMSPRERDPPPQLPAPARLPAHG